MLTRRALLTLGCAATGSIAGCLTRIPGLDRQDNGATIGIDQIAVQNDDDVHHEVSVVIEDEDGTEVFQEQLALDAGTADGFLKPVDEMGDYTLRVTVGTTTVQERLVDHTEDDERCVISIVRIRDADVVAVLNHAFNDCSDD